MLEVLARGLFVLLGLWFFAEGWAARGAAAGACLVAGVFMLLTAFRVAEPQPLAVVSTRDSAGALRRRRRGHRARPR